MATDTRNDPYRGFNFRVEIDGLPVGGFSEVSGLTADGDVVDYREGTDPPTTSQARGPAQVREHRAQARLHAERHAVALVPAHRATAARPAQRQRSCCMNEAHSDVLRWNFENAWINKIEGPGLKAAGNEVAIESMELCHEGLTLELEPAVA